VCGGGDEAVVHGVGVQHSFPNHGWEEIIW